MFRARLTLAIALSVVVTGRATAGPPQLAPSQYATEQYGLTFKVPKSATYCPLPKNWVGSDHGTTIFLQKPSRCGGVGYPSSGREFYPDKLARLELFYAYWMGEDEPPEKPCRKVATLRFFGAKRSVCEEREHGLVIRTVKARYPTETEAIAYLTLVTSPARLKRDMATFESAASTFRTCSAIWSGPKRKFTTGRGPLCPKAARWF
jgi:hypothetical protein